MMHDNELDLVLLGVLVSVATLLVLAYRTRVPYPIMLVVGGGALGFIPGVPTLELPPELVLVAVLPPLLYAAAFFSSLRDLRDNVRPIGLLAIGLVTATTLGVAVVAHLLIDGMSWPAAFVLGAIVSPTDPVAATAIASRVGAPRRIVTVVEGESLVNDSTALIAYKFAIVAVVSGSFSLPSALMEFCVDAAGGIAIGVAVGYAIASLRRRIEDAPTEITISLCTPYFAYLPASALGVSAVLAAVTSGIWLGWRSPQLISPSTRIQAYAVWEVLVFLLNGLLFVLVGLQLPVVLDAISGRDATQLALWAAAISATVIVGRILWVFPLTYLPWWLSRRVREHEPQPQWRGVLVVAWCGMRGAVSLAAALALPLTTDAGSAFPQRDLIIFLSFSVILATLLVQGLTLPMIIDRLDIRDDGTAEARENKARILAAKAAIQRIDELIGEDWVRDESADRMKRLYEFRIRRFKARFDDEDDGTIEDGSQAYQRLRREVLEAERERVVSLRNDGTINDEVMHRIEHDIDLEDVRLDARPES